jgi:hypothetical protein
VTLPWKPHFVPTSVCITFLPNQGRLWRRDKVVAATTTSPWRDRPDVVAVHYFHTSVKMLSRLIRREKLGIDPALQATALDLNPVPIPACNSEASAFGGCPKNRPVCRWRRPDVYAGTLQQNGISVFGGRDSLARRSIYGRRSGKLGSRVESDGRWKIGQRNNRTTRWCRRWLRHTGSRLNRSHG